LAILDVTYINPLRNHKTSVGLKYLGSVVTYIIPYWNQNHEGTCFKAAAYIIYYSIKESQLK
jgi:hypothetical protein